MQYCVDEMTVVYLDRKVVAGAVLALAVAFVLGVVIGFLGRGGGGEGGMSGLGAHVREAGG